MRLKSERGYDAFAPEMGQNVDEEKNIENVEKNSFIVCVYNEIVVYLHC